MSKTKIYTTAGGRQLVVNKGAEIKLKGGTLDVSEGVVKRGTRETPLIETKDIKNKAVSPAKLSKEYSSLFISTEKKGTGLPMKIPHNLKAAPTPNNVFCTVYDNTNVDHWSFKDISTTSNTITVTATKGITFKVMAQVLGWSMSWNIKV